MTDDELIAKAAAWRAHCVWCDAEADKPCREWDKPIPGVHPERLEAARKIIAVVRDQIAAEALDAVAREWQFGGWTILTAPTPEGSIQSLALGQRVTDWLLARAEGASA